MGIAMNMDNYEIENDSLLEAQYSNEVLCSGWNPAIEQLSQQYAMPELGKQVSMPGSLALVDPEAFLQKMYACQR